MLKKKILTAAIALTFSGAALADTIYVTDDGDAGPDTFRAAVMAANGDPAIDTIMFASPLSVTLESEVHYTGSQDLAIAGSGSTLTGDCPLASTWGGGLFASYSAAAISLSDLSFVESCNNGVGVFIPEDASGEVAITLDNVNIIDSRFHGLYADNQDSTGVYNTDDVPHPDCEDPHPYDSKAGIVLYVTDSSIDGNGTVGLVSPAHRGLHRTPEQVRDVPHPPVARRELEVDDGDVLALVYIDGRPQIILERGGAVRLSPRVRRETLAEIERIAGVITGDCLPEQWSITSREIDFFDVKGDVERLIAMRGASSESVFEAGELPWMHPGASAIVRLGGKAIGWCGALHPAVLKAFEIKKAVMAFELDLKELLLRDVPIAKPTSRFPSVRRDIAVMLPVDVTYSDVEKSIRSGAGAYLEDVVLFDVYAGKNLKEGYKSLAIGLIFNNVSSTLRDEDVDPAIEAVVSELEKRLGAQLRG